MTQATMQLFTLAEAHAHQQNPALPYSLREAVWTRHRTYKARSIDFAAQRLP